MRSVRRASARGRVTEIVGVLVAVGALAVFPTKPASAVPAHGGGGAITLVRAEPTGPDTVAIEVCVTFVLDREQADTARVTLSATGPGDLEVAPQDMTVGDQPGLRTGELTFPDVGSWTVRVTSVFPPAELAVPVRIDGERPDTGPTAGPVGPVGAGLAATCEPAGGPGLPTWLVAGFGTAGAVVVFGGLLLLLRRATAPEPDPVAEQEPVSLRPQRHQHG